MATQVPPKKNAAFTAFVGLVSQANTKVLQGSPTLASGDVTVSIDGGALSNLATLPVVTPAASKSVKMDLSAAEMNGDNIIVIFSDLAGAQWCDLLLDLQTTARQVDDLAFPTVSGRALDVSVGGEAGVDWANVGSQGTVVGLSGTTVKTATDVETDTADIQTRLPAALVGGRMNSNLSAINNATGGVTAFERSTRAIVEGTIGAASTTTNIVTSSLAPAAAVADQFKGRIIIFDEDTTTANLRAQATDITANTALGVLTVTALTTAPVSGDTFVIL